MHMRVNSPRKANIVIGCIYKHSGINFNEFHEFDQTNLFDKISKKQNKVLFLHGDFNINLLNDEQDTSENKLFDSLSSHLFLRYIFQPARGIENFKTLTDNIVSHANSPNILSNNLTSSISDHLPQFLITLNIFLNTQTLKYNIHKGNWFKLDQENFIVDYFSND